MVKPPVIVAVAVPTAPAAVSIVPSLIVPINDVGVQSIIHT